MDWRISDGVVDYPDAMAWMEERVLKIQQGYPECIWVLQHPPLYTAGVSAKEKDLLAPQFPVFNSGRGGQYTYHGPGQMVVYVMMNLNHHGRDIRVFIRHLENWIIAILAKFGLNAFTIPKKIGVWVKKESHDAKIAAIGVRVKKWVTCHGFALNINPNLEHFLGINPCGLKGIPVTSMQDMGINTDFATVVKTTKQAFDEATFNF